MIRDYYEHWPLIASERWLDDTEAAALLAEIQDRAAVLRHDGAARGIESVPHDVWVAAEAEVLARHGLPPEWRLLDRLGHPVTEYPDAR